MLLETSTLIAEELKKLPFQRHRAGEKGHIDTGDGNANFVFSLKRILQGQKQDYSEIGFAHETDLLPSHSPQCPQRQTPHSAQSPFCPFQREQVNEENLTFI